MTKEQFLKEAQDSLHNQQIGLFATKSVEELEMYIDQLNGNEKAIAAMVYGLTWNTAMQSAAVIIERSGENENA